MSDDSRNCPSCGAVLPADAPDVLCPRCLIQAAPASDRAQPITDAPTIPPEPGRTSVLASLANVIGRVTSVHLRDTDPTEDSPTLVPTGPAEMPGSGDASGRYRLLGEIARGGMGAVLRGRDNDLGRDLAVKVLLEAHQDNPELIRRFVEEAQIGGQLQHPGVVPIYDLGAFPDRRPFFTMKLVKGRTLAELLGERGRVSAPSEPQQTPGTDATGLAVDLPRFLSIFEAVCQTMAYAHTRGVIHRDLKPSNIMVGGFGEVQVMDWGLAKVLLQRGVADEEKQTAAVPDASVIQTARTGSDADASQAGSVLGTPAYMAPEQARGEVELVDERADVFGLGAILCEVLTGEPAFTGRSVQAILIKAAFGELDEAFARLDRCEGGPELVALAKHCLAAEREGRPRTARDVAGAITAYLAGVQERLRQTELARVAATARAEEERKRRKLTLALAASIVGTSLVGGGGWYWNQRQRQERAARADLALREAEVLRDQAEQAGDDLTRWTAARDAAHAVKRLLADARDERTRRRVTDLVQAVDAAATAADNDRKLRDTLIDIRSAKEDDHDGSATDAAYAGAFGDAGIDVVALLPAAAGAKIQARPSTVAVALSAALDDWAAVRRDRRRDQAGAARVAQAARAADPDPWRIGLRDALESSEPQKRLDALHLLVGSARFEELPPISLHLLGVALRDAGDAPTAERVLRQAQRRHAGDVWLNYDLALCLERLARREEAIRYYTAARAIRPETAHVLAHALQSRGEPEEAIAVFQDLVRLRPDNGHHLVCLGQALRARGRNQEATIALDAGIAALRADLRRRPDDASAHGNLGVALREQGKLDEAIASFRESIRLRPNFAQAHFNLGLTVYDQGKLPEAIAEYREAIRHRPDDSLAHARLGLALKSQGKLDKAIIASREAIRLNPDLAFAHTNLGEALESQGKLDEAVAEYRKVVRLKPDDAEAHTTLGAFLCDRKRDFDGAIAEFQLVIRFKPDDAFAHANLGIAQMHRGKLPEAIAAYRAAIRLKPSFAEAQFRLGEALRDQGNLLEAIAAYREVIRLQPDYAEGHCNLGLALREQGRYMEALPALRRGHELGSKRPGWPYPSDEWVRDCERMAPLEAKLPAIVKGEAQPADAAERIAIAQILYRKQWYAATAQLCALAFQADGRLADDVRAGNRYNAACSAALAGCGQSKDDPPPSAELRNRLRQQARDWLKADLAACSKLLESSPPEARQSIAKTLQQWKADSNLAGLRDPEALQRLPEDEQKACRALWAEVDTALKKAEKSSP